VILASRSSRRQEILSRLGVTFQVKPADIDETVDPLVPPREQAMSLAARKAAHVAAGMQRGLVLGADTMVILGTEVFGKPAGAAEARAMLARLAGRTHVVTTGLALIDIERKTRCLTWEDTRVHMRPMSEAEIEAYVDTGEPLDKAGAYAIQGHGAVFIDWIDGCYYNVVGLPVVRLLSMLREVDGSRVPVDGTRVPDPRESYRS
jgi:septum formation protein